MIRHLARAIAVLLIAGRVSTAANFSREFNLNDDHERYLFSVTNAEVYTGEIEFWRPSEPMKEGQVIYRFDTADRILWSNLFADMRVFTYGSTLPNHDPLAYVYLDASRDGQNWRVVNAHYPGNPRPNTFVKDISGAVAGGAEIYVRARLFGSVETADGLIYTQFLPTALDSQAPSFRLHAETIPEPCSLLLLICGVCCCAIWKTAANRAR